MTFKQMFQLCLAAFIGASFAFGVDALSAPAQQGTGPGIPSGPGGAPPLSPALGAQVLYTTPYQPRGNPGDYVFGKTTLTAAAPGFAALTAHAKSGVVPGSCVLVLVAGTSNREYVVPVVNNGSVDLTGSVGQGC